MDSLSQQIQKLTLDKDRAEDKKSRLEEDLAKLEESKKKFDFEASEEIALRFNGVVHLFDFRL